MKTNQSSSPSRLRRFRHRSHILKKAVGAGLLVVMIGCDSNLPATVTGTVAVNGQLLDKGDIGFYPTAGGPPAMSTVRPDGTFELSTGRQRGLKLGEYKVAVTSYKEPLKPWMSQKKIDEISNVHERYRSRDTTDVIVEVVSGSNEFTIELKPPE